MLFDQCIAAELCQAELGQKALPIEISDEEVQEPMNKCPSSVLIPIEGAPAYDPPEAPPMPGAEGCLVPDPAAPAYHPPEAPPTLPGGEGCVVADPTTLGDVVPMGDGSSAIENEYPKETASKKKRLRQMGVLDQDGMVLINKKRKVLSRFVKLPPNMGATAAKPLEAKDGSDQPEPLADGSDQPEPLADCSDQTPDDGSDHGSDQPEPLADGSDQPEPLADGSDQPEPLAGGSDQPEPLADGSDQLEPLANGSDQLEPPADYPDAHAGVPESMEDGILRHRDQQRLREGLGMAEGKEKPKPKRKPKAKSQPKRKSKKSEPASKQANDGKPKKTKPRLVSEEEIQVFKLTLALLKNAFVLLFVHLIARGYFRLFHLQTFNFYTDILVRKMRNSEDYTIVPYWTRLQVGVKAKCSKRQVWATTSATPASFEEKMTLAHAVVSCQDSLVEGVWAGCAHFCLCNAQVSI